jgi:cysteine desulfurase/selenocysteine lyase
MTTSTPRNEARADDAAAPHDLALLTRLAGEMFRELPGGGAPSAASLPPAGTGAPPGGVPVAGFGATPEVVPPFADVPGLPATTPSDVALRTLLAPIFGGTPAVPSGALSSPVSNGVPQPPPGGVPAGGFGAAPQAPGGLLPSPFPGLADLGGLSASIPGEAHLRALFAPAPGGGASAPPATAVPPGTIGAPVGGPPAVPTETAPAFPGIAGSNDPAAQFLAGIPPLSTDLPGDADLRALLAPARPETPPLAGAATPAPPPTFYFLDNGVPGWAGDTPQVTQGGHPAFDAAAVRADFPILSEQVNGRPLIWLDNAATTQKPQAVIDRLSYFYRHENSNIHRAAHELAARATDAYEKAREAVRRFLGAASSDNIVFVRGATEGINLVAKSWGRQHVRSGDEILITWLEHHANIVPWQQLADEVGARLRIAPVDDRGQIRLDEFEKLLSDRTKIVALPQVSNALGTVTPAAEMVRLARRRGAHVLVDGAQAVSHMPVNVQELDCDWFVFSGHKLFAPTGIGVVYARASVWEATPPWQGGGNMIRDVTFEKTAYQDPPYRFEAGTGNIADAVGLGAAIEYLERLGMANIARYEHDLLVYATRLLSDIPGLRIIGTAAEKAGVISFVLKDIPPEEVGHALNQEGIAVRAGHHCAQPILRRFGLEATVRPSLAFYNTYGDVDALAAAVRRIAASAPT